jgi:hypothetical protein
MYSPKHSYKNPNPDTLNIKLEKKDEDFGKFLAMTFLKDVQFEEIFQDFVEQKLPEFLTPSTTAGNSSKESTLKAKLNKCVHTNKPHYAKVK